MPRLRPCGVTVATLALLSGAWSEGCTTIDPGPSFVIPDQTFDANYFFCHVEPEVLFAKSCGPGDPSLGDRANGCHYTPSAVSGMVLVSHAPIDCGGGDAPLDQTEVGPGSPAQNNLEAASLEMSQDYLTAPIVVRPTGHSHPRAIFTLTDPVVAILATWATK